MKNAIPLLSVLAMAAYLPAQSTGTLKTATPVSVFAKSGSASDFAVAKKDTIIKVLTLRAQTTNAEAATSASITQSGGNGLCTGTGMHGGGMHGGGMKGGMHGGGMHGGGMHGGSMHGQGMCPGGGMKHMHVHIDEMGSTSATGSSSGTSSSLTAGTLKPGPHSFQYSIPAGKGAKGTLHITWMGMASGGGAVRVAIDVNGDNKPDFTASQKDMMVQKSLSVVPGTAGFVFLITTEGNASSSRMMGKASYGGCLNLSFEDLSRNDGLRSNSSGCGPELCGNLSSSNGTHTLDLKLKNAAPNSLGVLVIGSSKASYPIPGTTCILETNPIYYLPFRTNGDGEATQRFSFWYAGQPRGFLQDLVFSIGGNGLDIRTSNVLQLQ